MAGRPRLLEAHRPMAFRLELSQIHRVEKLIQISGKTQAQFLRQAVVEFLDRHDASQTI